MKIYTRTGDKGQTSLFGGERVSKTNARVRAYGMLDELNSYLGICAAVIKLKQKSKSKIIPSSDYKWVLQVQRDLFAIGSWLASKEASVRVDKGQEAFPGARKDKTHLDAARVLELEKNIDAWEKKLAPMKSFILPGGSELGANLHYARALCRRAEREAILLREQGEIVPEIVIQYLNRLADALFVFARHINRLMRTKEEPWN